MGNGSSPPPRWWRNSSIFFSHINTASSLWDVVYIVSWRMVPSDGSRRCGEQTWRLTHGTGHKVYRLHRSFQVQRPWYPQATVRFPPNLKLQLSLHDSGLLMLVDQQANSDCSEYPEELGCSAHDEQGRLRLKFTEFTTMYFGASIENA